MEDVEDNITRQAEEIEALCSIYGDQWKIEDACNQAYSIRVLHGDLEVVLHITLPSDYPSHSPPSYLISAPTLSREDKLELSNRLENIYLDSIGENILYQWGECVKEFIQKKSNQQASTEETECTVEEHCSVLEPTRFENVPLITHGEVITDRKSIFQGHVAGITSVDQVKLVLSILMKNKKILNATHNIYAYRVQKGGCTVQDCEDDGETAAGGRLLHLLQIMNMMNVLVVVTRWYGGVHLGPDRFRHINNAARQALQLSGLSTNKK